MTNKLKHEDFYSQFHNLEHHHDSMDADRSLLDNMNPNELYRSGRAIDFKKERHEHHRTHHDYVDHALRLTSHHIPGRR